MLAQRPNSGTLSTRRGAAGLVKPQSI